MVTKKETKDHERRTRIQFRKEGIRYSIRVIKDKYPDDGKCVLCHKVKLLGYHHYGKITPHQYLPGLWLCVSCHQFAEVMDNVKDCVSKYQTLKHQAVMKAPKIKDLLDYVRT